MLPCPFLHPRNPTNFVYVSINNSIVFLDADSVSSEIQLASNPDSKAASKFFTTNEGDDHFSNSRDFIDIGVDIFYSVNGSLRD